MLTLLLCASASAGTVLVPDEASLLEALADASVDTILLTKDYDPAEGRGFVDGVYVDRSVALRSDVSGEPRPAPPLFIAGAGVEVQLQDLDFADTQQQFKDSTGTSRAAPYTAALFVSDGADVIGQDLDVALGVTASQLIPVVVSVASLSIDGLSVHDTELADYADTNAPEFWTWLGSAVVVRTEDGGGAELRLSNSEISGGDMGCLYVGQESYPANRTTVVLDNVVLRDCLREDVGPVHLLATDATFTDVAIEGTDSLSSAGALHLRWSDLSWTGGALLDTTGGAGGGLWLDESDAALSRLQVDNAQAALGGLAYLDNSASLELDQVDVEAGGADLGGLVYALSGEVTMQRTRVCGVSSDEGGAAYARGPLKLTNVVFQGLSGGSAVEGYDRIEAENVTFVGFDGAALLGSPLALSLVNTAMVALDTAVSVAPVSADIRYNAFWGNGRNAEDSVDLGPDLVDADPLWVAGFDPTDCSTDPVPAEGSPLVNAGDPSVFDLWDDTRSDIGAFGGPGVWEDYVGPDPGEEDPGDSLSLPTLSGGCGGSGAALGLLLVPVFGFRRRTAS